MRATADGRAVITSMDYPQRTAFRMLSELARRFEDSFGADFASARDLLAIKAGLTAPLRASAPLSGRRHRRPRRKRRRAGRSGEGRHAEQHKRRPQGTARPPFPLRARVHAGIH
eukprot:IDg11520t1